MSNFLHKRQLSRLKLNRPICVAIALTVILTGGYSLGAKAHSEHQDFDHEEFCLEWRR